MDAKPASSVVVPSILLALCVAVGAVGVAWPAWDMFGPTKRPMLQGWDDSFYYFWLPSVVIDHDVDFSNQLAHSSTIDAGTRDLALSLPRTATGLLDNKYPPGLAIGSLPFFLAAHVLAPAGSTGFEPIYLVAVCIGQFVYALAGMWCAIKILERYFSPTIAVSAALIGWLTSPLVYYQTARLSMSHSQVFALAMGVFWLTFRVIDRAARWRDWLALGFLATLLVVTRNFAAVYLIFPAVVVIRRVRSFGPAAGLILGALGPAAAQLLAWKLLYGSWIAYSYGGERFDFQHSHLAAILFSPRHGWFYWHPLILPAMLAFAGWAWFRTEGRSWLSSLVVVVGLSATWPTWWLGSSFGYRGLEVATFFAMIGLASLFELVRQRPSLRRILIGVVTFAIAWNLALFGLFLTQRIPREDPVSYGDVIQSLTHW
jgi:hypothetical protein